MASQPAMNVDPAEAGGPATQTGVGETTPFEIATPGKEVETKGGDEKAVNLELEGGTASERIDKDIDPRSSKSELPAARQDKASELGDGRLQTEPSPATTEEEMPEQQISSPQLKSTSGEAGAMTKGQKSSPPPAADIVRRTISPAAPAVTADTVEVKTQSSDAVVGSPAQSTLLDSVMSSASNMTSPPSTSGDSRNQRSQSEQGQLPIRQPSHSARWSPTLSGSTPTTNTAGPSSSSSTTLPPHSPASLPGNSPSARLHHHHHQHPQQQYPPQAGPSRRAATTTGIPAYPHHKPNPSTSSSSMAAHNPNSPPPAFPTPLTPTLPSTSSALPTAEARDAIIASMSNLLDHKLQTRATQLHANSSALTKQENDIIRATESLRKETGKLEKVAKDAGKKVKELGNVQNWAEVLERDLLVIEETIRLANARRGGSSEDGEEDGSERCSECEGSCCWSGSQSGSASGSDDEEGGGDGGNERRKKRRRDEGELGEEDEDDGPSMMKFRGVNVEINDDLLASLSEAMRLDIYEDDKKNDGNSFGDPTDSGISVATPTSSKSLDRSQGTPSQGDSSIDSRLELV